MYNKTIWNNNAAPYIDSTNLNKIEVGIDDAHTDIAVLRSEAWNDWQAMTVADDTSTLITNDRIFADTLGGTFTLNLPVGPSVGDRLLFTDVAGNFATASLIINGNGDNVMGEATLELDVDNSATEITYSGAVNGWRITSRA